MRDSKVIATGKTAIEWGFDEFDLVDEVVGCNPLFKQLC